MLPLHRNQSVDMICIVNQFTDSIQWRENQPVMLEVETLFGFLCNVSLPEFFRQKNYSSFLTPFNNNSRKKFSSHFIHLHDFPCSIMTLKKLGLIFLRDPGEKWFKIRSAKWRRNPSNALHHSQNLLSTKYKVPFNSV